VRQVQNKTEQQDNRDRQPRDIYRQLQHNRTTEGERGRERERENHRKERTTETTTDNKGQQDNRSQRQNRITGDSILTKQDNRRQYSKPGQQEPV
jgi:hypothetical protein